MNLAALARWSCLPLLTLGTAWSRGVEGPAPEEPLVLDVGFHAPPGPLERDEVVQWFVTGDHDRQAWAAELLVELDAADWPDNADGRFLRKLAPAALVSGWEHRLPPSLTLAQGALESGWGRSGLASEHNNLFGIKAHSGEPSVTVHNTEYANGRYYTATSRFRIFGSWDESVEHHAARLRSYPRTEALWTDWHALLSSFARGYASDPNYIGKISGIIRRYDLDRWDQLIVQGLSAQDGFIADAEPEPGEEE